MPEPTYRVLSPSLSKLASAEESATDGMYKELARDADIREESQVAMDVDAPLMRRLSKLSMPNVKRQKTVICCVEKPPRNKCIFCKYALDRRFPPA